MKIEFYKARHIWVNGQNATWTKSDKFDFEIFEKLKNEYEELKSDKKKVINFNGKILFLFYRSRKDFSQRPITEITAFLSNTNFNKNEKVHESLASQIQDVFEDKLNYVINIDKNYVNFSKNGRGKTIGVIMGLIAMSIVTAMFLSTSSTNGISKKNEESKIKDVNISENNSSKVKIKTPKVLQEKNSTIVKKKITRTKEKIQVNPKNHEKIIKNHKVDFEDFVNEWNEKITKLTDKYKINLEKYHIDKRQDILSQVNGFINYKEKEAKNEKKVSKKIKGIYKTLDNWIEKRKKKFKNNKITKVFTSSKLRKAIEEKLNLRKSFSKKTIEDIILWNEFTLFFEKNKTESDENYGFESCQDVKDRVLKRYKLTIDCID